MEQDFNKRFRMKHEPMLLPVTQNEFDAAYVEHQKWLADNSTGKCMDFSNREIDKDVYAIDCDLSHANFSLCLFPLYKHPALDEPTFQDCNFSHARFRSARVASKRFVRCNFAHVDMQWATCKDVLLSQCDFEHANLNGTKVLDSAVIRCSFNYADLCHFKGATSSFESCNGHGASIFNTDISLMDMFDIGSPQFFVRAIKHDGGFKMFVSFLNEKGSHESGFVTFDEFEYMGAKLKEKPPALSAMYDAALNYMRTLNAIHYPLVTEVHNPKIVY